MRHTVVLVLGFVLFAMIMACGDPAATPTVVFIPEPTPDIEAKLEEDLRTHATLSEAIA
ncbi:MAG: hypothetical protein QGI49_12410 [SAR202 cluster bacterium]|nr:hypothetical protein [SAR202 cluster bacterium]